MKLADLERHLRSHSCVLYREKPSSTVWKMWGTLQQFLAGFPIVSRELAVAALEEAKHLLLARS